MFFENLPYFLENGVDINHKKEHVYAKSFLL